MERKELISLAFFLTLISIIVMDAALILPNQVLIAADLLSSDIANALPMIGLMIGVYTLIAGGSTLLFGYLTDIVKRKNLLLFSGFLWALTASLHFFVLEFWQLFILRMFAALATGVTTPVAFSFLADIVPSDSRSKAFAWWGLITTLGGLIAGAIALAFNQIPYEKIDPETEGIKNNLTYIINNYPNLLDTWRIPFLYLGLFALILTILNIFFTREPKRAASEKVFEDLSEDELQYSYRIKKEDLKYIFKRKSNFFLIMNLFDVVASGILVAFIFPYINLEMGISFGDPSGLAKVIVLLLIAAPLGFIVGQFGISHYADKKVQSGEITGRIKVATICGILNLPFLLFAFTMSPNVRNSSFFFGMVGVDEVTFWILWIIFASFLGIGLAFTFGIAPNWYASLIDINFPEHRGTMIAMASFLDAIGRALGAIFGGIFIGITDSIAGTIFWATLIFGVVSTCFWIPLFYTCQEDFDEVQSVMKQRAEEMKRKSSNEETTLSQGKEQ
ncbi:MAG: MFS transporter [Promethearchaeota archaeon]|nr:MAG: MFS transporter [Candidatus Lokiarchaeota archaeon]